MVDPLTGLVVAGAISAHKTFSPAIQRFLESAAEPPGTALGERMAERIKKNQETVVEGAMEIDPELRAEDIPPRALAGVLAGAGLEGDAEMLHRWSALLASSRNPLPPGFADILAQLGSVEVRVLDLVYGAVRERSPEEWSWVGLPVGRVAELVGVDRDRAILACEALDRQRLTHAGNTQAGSAVPNLAHGNYTGNVCLTRLGHAFASACRPPSARYVPVVKSAEEVKESVRAATRR